MSGLRVVLLALLLLVAMETSLQDAGRGKSMRRHQSRANMYTLMRKMRSCGFCTYDSECAGCPHTKCCIDSDTLDGECCNG
nr:TPA_inf: conotoxin precursor O3 [Conus judaeus]DAZ86849.1 TPA_inf: conotoxin precursor O3 [Conus judaeus]